MLCPVLKRPGLCRRWPLASREGMAMCAMRKERDTTAGKYTSVLTSLSCCLVRERSSSLSPFSRNPQSCELRGPAGAGSNQQFPFLSSSPIHFIPTRGWPTVISGRAPAQTSPTIPPVTVSWEPRLAVFLNSLWQSHPSFHSGKCHFMGEILPCPCPCPRCGFCFLVYPGQLEPA